MKPHQKIHLVEQAREEMDFTKFNLIAADLRRKYVDENRLAEWENLFLQDDGEDD